MTKNQPFLASLPNVDPEVDRDLNTLRLGANKAFSQKEESNYKDV